MCSGGHRGPETGTGSAEDAQLQDELSLRRGRGSLCGRGSCGARSMASVLPWVPDGFHHSGSSVGMFGKTDGFLVREESEASLKISFMRSVREAGWMFVLR